MRLSVWLLGLMGFATACGVSNKPSVKAEESAVPDTGTIKVQPEIRVMYGVAARTYKTAPLVFVDGVEVPNDTLQAIDPKTIDSIKVVKPEIAVAEFGEKAANGVVQVYTKK